MNLASFPVNTTEGGEGGLGGRRKRECGGEKGRRMSLDTFTGVVVIEVVGFDPIQL